LGRYPIQIGDVVLDALLGALHQVLTPESLMMMGLGVVLGFVVGILPGLGGAVTIALLLPFTFDMDPVPAFALLLGMYVVTSTTGDITSVLFGVPGEASAAAVVLDGYPLTKRGQAGRALGAVLTSSAAGAVFGVIVLVVSIPILRPLILNIGPPELFGVALLGLTFVVTLSGKKLHKGLIMAGLGVLISMIGLDPSTGSPRYTFDVLYLWAGIGIIPVVIGLFGGAEVIQIMLDKNSRSRASAHSKIGGVGTGIRDTLRHWSLVLRASAIGSAIGIVPGMGGSVAQFIAYGHAKQTSKQPESFGRGAIEGVIAAGATNNAKDSGSLIPTIAFGIPGSASTAVLLGAFLILGLEPGPQMLTTNLEVTLSMVWITVFATFASVALAFILLKPLTSLTLVSGRLLVPFLILLLAIGAFSASNSFDDVLVMLLFLAIGIACIKWDWPRVPLLLGLVLGGIMERYLFLSNSIFGSAWMTRPSFLAIVACIGLVFLAHFLRLRQGRKKSRLEEKEKAEANR
jgi:putative tricarboxylic transport membrane protein